MHGMKKKIGLTAVGLTLVLSMIGALDGTSAFAEEAPATTSTTVAPATEETPSTTEAPPTTQAGDAAATEPTTTTVAPEPSEPESASTETRATRNGERWGPDPRWIDYGTCGSGYTACHVAKAHQRRGLFQWRHGKWFRWGNDLVRGHRGETWLNFQREARQVRMYLYALAVARHRAALVSRWQGVANCESGGNWSIATGNGYYGGLQFSLGTWQAYGGEGMPNQKPAWYQATIADRVRVDSGLGHWPVCGSNYG